MLANCNSCASGINQADSFIRKLACRDVAVGKFHGCLNCFIENNYVMVFFQRSIQCPKHVDGFVFVGLIHLHHLETAGQGRVFLKVFFVLCPCCRADGTQFASGERRFEQVGCIARTGCPTCTNQGMDFVDKEHNGGRAGFHFVHNCSEP